MPVKRAGLETRDTADLEVCAMGAVSKFADDHSDSFPSWDFGSRV